MGLRRRSFVISNNKVCEYNFIEQKFRISGKFEIFFFNIIFSQLIFFLSQKKEQTSKKFKWVDAAKEFYIKSKSQVFRNEKMCRDRWISHLDPSLKRFLLISLC